MLVHRTKLTFKVFHNLQSELVAHTADLSGTTELDIIEPTSGTRPTATALFETAEQIMLYLKTIVFEQFVN